jgi:hypothetical protein
MVYITRDEFDTTTVDGVTALLRSMYNFKDMVLNGASTWDRDKEGLCTKVATFLRPIPSLSKQSKSRGTPNTSSPPIARHEGPVVGQGYRNFTVSTTVCALRDGSPPES